MGRLAGRCAVWLYLNIQIPERANRQLSGDSVRDETQVLWPDEVRAGLNRTHRKAHDGAPVFTTEREDDKSKPLIGQ
jgi:hypothetical protein